jgi:hypothetical protein
MEEVEEEVEPVVVAAAAVVVVAVAVDTTVVAQPNGNLAITFLQPLSPTLFHLSTPLLPDYYSNYFEDGVFG